MLDILQHTLVLLLPNFNRNVLIPMHPNWTRIRTMLLLRVLCHHADLEVPFLKSQILVYKLVDLQREAW